MWNGNIQKLKFPKLYSYANKKIQLHKASQSNHIHMFCKIPLSDEAYNQFIDLQSMLTDIAVSEGSIYTGHTLLLLFKSLQSHVKHNVFLVAFKKID
ncbi:hypothetical protein GQ55_3G346400 [Panicum hallii var. hallii]|jgi:hypothetical protein|uniref:Uncharacterized protein n=1 Tax=Panicum hallii var. hallii TaxID=1504633 RepID=A0A2T7EFR4_9POAL|nr:hypothetical protein GQ55_3G346400 [Panicum hallii var. hallii]